MGISGHVYSAAGRVRDLADALDLSSDDLEVMTRNTDAVFRDAEEDLFVSEGASGGAPWADLTEPYATRKARAGAGVRARNRLSVRAAAPSRERPVSTKILRWSENLMRSLTRAGHSEHLAESRGTVGRAEITVGTRNVLAFYHHEGNERMAARDPVQMTDEQKAALVKPSHDYVAAKLLARHRSFQARSGAGKVYSE